MRTAETAESYPPYNIARTGEDAYRITLAVVGFAPAQEEGVTYLHEGIAGRAFQRRFQLADHVEVVNADLANGLLKIELVRRVPEAMKPRKIQIAAGQGRGQGNQANVIEHDNNKASKKMA
jgi:molecular chaperone IbpA